MHAIGNGICLDDDDALTRDAPRTATPENERRLELDDGKEAELAPAPSSPSKAPLCPAGWAAGLGEWRGGSCGWARGPGRCAERGWRVVVSIARWSRR